MTISFSNGSIMTLYAGRKMNWLYLSSLSFQPSLWLYHQTIVLFLSSQLLSVSLDKHIFCRSPTPTLRLLGQPTLLQITSMNRIQVGLREYKNTKVLHVPVNESTGNCWPKYRTSLHVHSMVRGGQRWSQQPAKPKLLPKQVWDRGEAGREKKVHMGQLNDGKGLRELNLMIPLQIPDQQVIGTQLQQQ